VTIRNLVVSGGPLHDFAATTTALVALANAEAIASEVPLDPTAALDRLADAPGFDLVTINALLWSMPAARHAPLRDGWSHRLADEQTEALVAHVVGGGGLLACHTAAICFDGDPRWRSLLGASWDWDRSHHPPLGPASVVRTAAGADHPITAPTEDFETTDEIYAQLAHDDDVEPLLTSAVDGTDQPVLWTRTVGRGRVVVDLLGHDRDAVTHPAHAAIVRRALRWLVAGDASATPTLPEPEAIP
jgi:type 1 glutamine amidotransferase